MENPNLPSQICKESPSDLNGETKHNPPTYILLWLYRSALLENPSKPTKPHEFCMENRFHIFGSCNGLLCLFYVDQGYVQLWNPTIRFKSKKSQTLHSYDKRMWVKYHGFGYDHINDKYKLLVVVYLDIASYDSEKVTKIYTFGGTSWTTIENFPSAPGYVTSFAGKFVSGTLDWLIVKRGVSSNQDVILFLSFDLVKETYKEVLLPEHDGDEIHNAKDGIQNICQIFAL
ncbi:F-box/kelch-repeat protein At3g23880-like [Trifolium pratense]|uniref:F-box/kelch-repeat protein At3g23880-like n=1 Tax=Trifolium pratense TaxID=57577 RepID=UPI001E694286|nr:F-box/kelch-repeat protein At3g23880-like [Trifolium pratense]